MGRPRGKKSKTLLGTSGVGEASPSLKSGPFIPPEIISMILDELLKEFTDVRDARPQLCILARTSRLFQVEAERRLYERVLFNVGDPQAQKIATVLQSRAAGYVRYLGIEKYGVARRRGRTSDRAVSALPFARMTRLCSLYVASERDSKYKSIIEVDPELFLLLDRHLPPNILRQFANNLPIPPSYLRFLKRQSSLEDLCCTFQSRKAEGSDIPFDPSTHSKLVELQALDLDENILAIMESTRIRKLRIFADFTIPKDWASYATHLVRLDVLDCALGPVQLSEVVRCCPQLQILEFTAAPHWILVQDIGVFEILQSLPMLRACAIKVSVFVGFIERVMKGLFRCELLEAVMIVIGQAGFELVRTGQKSGNFDMDWHSRETPRFDRATWTQRQDARIDGFSDMPILVSSSLVTL
ncbi:hypothetical protein SISNIDRAFT_455959 [Sistotremastrum niveocremeum HHB9708]|uniref:F-box domain-containing protein n=1 Tax=Sistotremastrum niveocremeum HHB9708 TaxID=1314777 RepID=A0A164TAC9_9AGAM|nr:hypothetical protein SISNIDRAFT_455959 [Sistotremastrum niveocremeum HHB9708]